MIDRRTTEHKRRPPRASPGRWGQVAPFDTRRPSSADRHLFGDLYEQILKDLQSAGNAREFYTPRAVTQFMVDMVDPKLGEKMLDPACGTGGFLVCAIEHVRKKYVKSAKDEAKLQKLITGVEKKQLPHLWPAAESPQGVAYPNAARRGAEQYEHELRASLLAGSYGRKEAEPIPTLSEFADEFLETYARSNNKLSEIESKRSVLRGWLKPRLGKRTLDDIGVRDVEALEASMFKKGRSP